MEITWRTYCSGLVLGAFDERGIVRAAISGPHPNGRYALTFYGKDARRELLLSRREKAQDVAERVLRAWERAREALEARYEALDGSRG